MAKTPSKTASKPAAPAPAAPPKGPPQRLFYSDTGEDIRVTLPDGGVALVGSTPRPLPPRFHRAAQRAGCITQGSVRAEVFQPAVEDDPHERQEALVRIITEALESDPPEGATDAEHEAYNAKYADAFNQDETPNVRWLEKQAGFPVSQLERDQAWATVRSDLGLDEEGEDDEDAPPVPNSGFSAE